MQIIPSTLAAIYYNFNLFFQSAFDSYAPWWQRLATRFPSSTRESRYAWMARNPRMREWIGDRMIHNLVMRATTIANKRWEDTIRVDRDDIEDDQLGGYEGRLAELARAAAFWPQDMLVTLIDSGITTICEDGQYFFDTDHPYNVDKPGLGQYSNLYTLSLTADNFNTVRAGMRSILGEDGKPLAVNPKLLCVAPQNERNANQIVNSETVLQTGTGAANVAVAGVSNVMKGWSQVLVIEDWATNPDRWMLVDDSRPVKPFIFQERRAPTLTQLTDPTMENVFMRAEFLYGLDSRGNVGFGLPHLAALSDPTP